MVNRSLQIDWNAVFTNISLFMLTLALTRFSMRLLETTSETELFPQTIDEKRKLKFAREPIRDIDQDTFLEWIESGKVELLQGGGPSRQGYKPTLVVIDDKIYAAVRHVVRSGEVLKTGVRLISASYRDVAEETLHEAEEHGLLLPEVKLLPQTRMEPSPHKVTVECPICGKVIDIPEYDSITRTEVLKRHIQQEHALKKLSAKTERKGNVKIVITSETGGYDVSAIDEAGHKLRTAWGYDRNDALMKARSMADFYRDFHNQPAQIEWLTYLLPQVTVEGGEPIPPQYRYLVGWIDEPLPESSLMTLPAVEVREGERKIEAVLRELKRGVEGIQQSDNFRLFLTTMSKFHDYSVGNLILIGIQKPDATYVAGYNTWKELERHVKEGEKGIAIQAPIFPPRPICAVCGARIPRGAKYCPQCGEPVEVEEMGLTPSYFKVVHVFDISQTEGKPLPEFEVPVLTGEANEELFNKVMALAKKQGLTMSFEPRPHQDPAIKGQYFGKTIWVKPDEPRAQQLKSLLHEIAHYYSEGVFTIPTVDAETIAESAAYVVGAHYGFDTGVRSFPYVALWAKDKKVLEENLKAIRRVATTILEELEKTE